MPEGLQLSVAQPAFGYLPLVVAGTTANTNPTTDPAAGAFQVKRLPLGHPVVLISRFLLTSLHGFDVSVRSKPLNLLIIRFLTSDLAGLVVGSNTFGTDISTFLFSPSEKSGVPSLVHILFLMTILLLPSKISGRYWAFFENFISVRWVWW